MPIGVEILGEKLVPKITKSLFFCANIRFFECAHSFVANYVKRSLMLSLHLHHTEFKNSVLSSFSLLLKWKSKLFIRNIFSYAQVIQWVYICRCHSSSYFPSLSLHIHLAWNERKNQRKMDEIAHVENENENGNGIRIILRNSTTKRFPSKFRLKKHEAECAKLDVKKRIC